jgi:HPt (histidine-containing phosphotransfer) domain-containing protein
MLVAQRIESTAFDRPLDLVHLSRQTLGDRHLEREVLAIFRQQARRVLFQLEALTDPSNRLEIAHALNGSAKGVGAWRVATAAEALEEAARSGKNVGEQVALLAESISQVVDEIDELLTEA